MAEASYIDISLALGVPLVVYIRVERFTSDSSVSCSYLDSEPIKLTSASEPRDSRYENHPGPYAFAPRRCGDVRDEVVRAH